jgi:hypothetical protein
MRGSESQPSFLHGLEENVAKYGPIFGFYFGQTPAVVLADYDLIKEAFKSEQLAARPSIEPFQQVRPGLTFYMIFNRNLLTNNMWYEISF